LDIDGKSLDIDGKAYC